MNDLNPTAPGLAIFNANGLQWVSNETEEIDALREFDAEVGIDPDDEGLDALRDGGDFEFREISADEMPEWVDAEVHDHPDA